MLSSFPVVFKKPAYALTAAAVAAAVFLFAVWLPNLPLIRTILFEDDIALSEKAAFLVSLLGSISTNFTAASATYTILIAILFGITVALFIYYIRRMQRASGALRGISGAGLGGLVSGILGIGCAACGTFILSSLLALIGAGGILSYLPYGGTEFGFAGVVLLLFAVHALDKKIQEPLVC